MIVQNALTLLVTLTFQRYILSILNNPDAVRLFAPDGSSMAVSVPSMPGIAVVFLGTGLDEDGEGHVTGNISNFQIIDANTASQLNGLLPLAILASAMLAAASGGSGAFNPVNYAAFYNLLMPSVFFQLLYSGAAKGEVVEGFAGDDDIVMGRGNDTYVLGSGNDRVNGGLGKHDKVDGSEQPGGLIMDLDRGVIRTSADERVKVRNFEDGDGSSFRDRIFGSIGDNRLNGRDGNDDIFGDDGGDTLNGGKGNDDIDGGAGDDVLTGGKGFDDFYKLPGEGNDIVTDFEEGADALDLIDYGFADLDEVLSFAEDTPAGVVFTFGPGDSLLVEGTTIAQLAPDIIF